MSRPQPTIPRRATSRRPLVAGRTTGSPGRGINLRSPGRDLQHAILGVIKRARWQRHLLELQSADIRFVAESDRCITTTTSDTATTGIPRVTRPLPTAHAIPTGTATAALRSSASRLRCPTTKLSGAPGIALSLLLEFFESPGLLL